jgi:hypothetical protein
MMMRMATMHRMLCQRRGCGQCGHDGRCAQKGCFGHGFVSRKVVPSQLLDSGDVPNFFALGIKPM